MEKPPNQGDSNDNERVETVSNVEDLSKHFLQGQVGNEKLVDIEREAQILDVTERLARKSEDFNQIKNAPLVDPGVESEVTQTANELLNKRLGSGEHLAGPLTAPVGAVVSGLGVLTVGGIAGLLEAGLAAGLIIVAPVVLGGGYSAYYLYKGVRNALAERKFRKKFGKSVDQILGDS